MTECAKLKLPDAPSTTPYLVVSARGYETENEEEGWSFTDSKTVRVYSSSSNVVIIQTDKPIYKPGQLGQSVASGLQIRSARELYYASVLYDMKSQRC